MTISLAAPPLLHLPGGLPLLLLPRQGPQLLAARLVVRGGSSRDPVGQRGAHQLLAGLMTRGCGDLDADALADRVEGLGAALRAEAHEDAVVVALKCAGADAAELLPLICAMVRRPRLEPDQLSLERQLNLQTLQRQREDPFQLAHDQLRTLLHGDGPYGHDPLGTEADLPGIGREQLLPLAEALGHEGAGVVLCGDVPAAAPELLKAGLGGRPWITAAPAAAPAAMHGDEPPPVPASRTASIELDTEQLVLLLGAATVPLAHPDTLALRMLQIHLGVGMSCRLFQTMREERGLAYDVGLHLPARLGPAPFVMHLSTGADRAAEATSCLLEEWRRVLAEPLSEVELALALAKFRGQEAMGRQTGSQIAERQALLLNHGLPADHVERQLARLPQLRPEDLQRAAGRWLQQPCLSLVGPSDALQAAEGAWGRHPLSRGPRRG